MLWMSAFRRYGPIERDFLSAKTYARQAIEDRGGSAYGCKSGEIEGILVPWLTLGFRKIRKGRSRGGILGLHKATYPRQGAEMWPPTHRNLRPGGNSRYGVPDSLAARPLWVVVGAFSPIIPDA